jgi:phage terminase large subunit
MTRVAIVAALLVACMADSAIARMAARIRGWRENPAQFAYEELKFEAGDPWQQRVFEVFPSQDPKKLRISLQACTGPGKTAILAVLNWNFISCYGSKGEHPQGLCTSITEDNLTGNLWPALAKWQARSDYLRAAFKWSASRVSSIDHPETWFLEGRNWSKRADAEALGRTLSGLHAKDVMVTVDESGDVPVPVLRSGEQIFSSRYRWAKLLQAGNPTSLDGALHHAATSDDWHIVIVTGDPDDPMRSIRVDIDNARRQIALWGRDNPWVKATILGQFPPSGINSLLGIDDVQAAMKRHYRPDQYQHSDRRFGVDAARTGVDRSVLFARQGIASFKPEQMRMPNGIDVAERVLFRHRAWPTNWVFIDDTGGWGHSIFDFLEKQPGVTAVSVQYHKPSSDPRYKSTRDLMWYEMAKWVKAGGALPDVPGLAKELTAPTYSYVGSKIVIEGKDQIKARLGYSPDLADALAQTFYYPEMLREAHGGQQQNRSDFNPFAPQSGGAAREMERAVRDGVFTHDWDPFA